MNLKNYIKDYQNEHSQFDKVACADMLRRAKRNLIHRIAQKANGSSELLGKILPEVKDFFGG